MRLHRLAGLTTVAVIAGVVLPVPATAAAPGALLVDGTAKEICSDQGTGTPDRPYCTLAAAAAVAQPGQTVEVRSLAMAETLQPIRSGTADQPIRFVAVNSGNDNWSRPAISAVTIAGLHDVTVAGFAINGAAVTVSRSSDVLVDNNFVNTGSGIVVDGGSTRVTVSRNQLPSSQLTVRGGATGTVVTGNAALNAGAPALRVIDAPGTVVTGNTLVTDCFTELQMEGTPAAR